MTGILAAVLRLPKAALGGIGVAAVGTGVFAASLVVGGADPSAQIQVLAGTVEVSLSEGGAFRAARDGEVLKPVATVRTGSDGRAGLKYFDGSISRLDFNTTFSLRELAGEIGKGGSRTIRARQTSGRTFNRVVKLTASTARVEVETPNATASVRGTEWVVVVGPDGREELKVFTGTVVWQLPSGEEVRVEAGHKVAVSADGQLGEVQETTQEDLDEWKQYNDCLDQQEQSPNVLACDDNPSDEEVILAQGEPAPTPETTTSQAQVVESTPTTEESSVFVPEPAPIVEEPEPTPDPTPEPTPSPTPEPEPQQLPPPPASPGAVAGTVRDGSAPDGAPIAGAVVTAEGPVDAESGATGTDGVYSIGDLPAGTYTLTATADGFLPATRSVVVVAGQTSLNIDFALGAEPGTIEGFVADRSGDAISGASVSLNGVAQPLDEDGKTFSFEAPALTSHTVTASAPGYDSQTVSDVTLERGEIRTLEFFLNPTPPSTGGISGTVNDDAGTTLAGVTVMLDVSTVATSSSDGSFLFAEVSPGEHSVKAGGSTNHFDSPAAAVTVEAGKTTPEVNLILTRHSAIHGTVTDAESGEPISGAVVAVGSITTTTVVNGNYVLGGLSTGTHDVRISKDGYVSNNERVLDLGAGEDRQVDLTLQLQGIEGRILEQGSNAPVAGATVTVSRDGFSASYGPTAEDGSYKFKGLEPGTYSLAASHEDYMSATQDGVVVVANELTVQDLTLTKRAGVSGKVLRFGTTQGIEGATVTLGDLQALTDSSGAYSFTRVAPGSYQIKAVAAKYVDGDPEDITVESGVSHTRDLALKPRPGTVEITVKDGDIPVVGASVTLAPIAGDPQATDADGKVKFTEVPARSGYSATATHAKYNDSPSTGEFSVEPAEDVSKTLSFSAPKSGTVEIAVNDGNTPVVGAIVTLAPGSAAPKTTDGSGKVKFLDVPVGSGYTATATHGNYDDSPSVGFSVGPAEDVTKTLSFARPRPGTVEITVRDDDGPVAGAAVSLSPSAAEAKNTDGNGQVTFTDVPAGTGYTAAATHNDYTDSPSTAPFAVGAFQNVEKTLEFDEPRPGKIIVNVTGIDGAIDALVSIDDGPEQSTGPDGSLLFDNMAVGNANPHTITARHADYEEAESKTVTLRPNQEASVEFDLAPVLGTIVVNVTGFQGIDLDASVSLDDADPVQIGDDGTITFEDQAVGADNPHSVAVAHEDYNGASEGPFTLGANGTRELDFSMVGKNGGVHGSVKDVDTDELLPGAGVTLLRGATEVASTTATDGNYSFPFGSVVPGVYAVRATAAPTHVANNEEVTVNPNGDAEANVQLRPEPGSVRGSITDGATNAPITHATVSLVDTQLSDTTDAAGDYTLPSVPRGSYTLSVTATNYATYTATIVVSPGIATTENVALERLTGHVEGIVKNATNGQAINGATVKLNGSTMSTETTGAYRFDSVPVGTYTLEGSATGFAATTRSVTVQADQTTTADLNLSPTLSAGELRIVLTWNDTPADLDAHFWLPSTNKYHVYYPSTQRGSETSCPFVALDRDDIDGRGPETVTIKRGYAGTYTYAVRDYTNRNQSQSTALSSSGALVQIFEGSTVRASFDVPAGRTGAWWKVFTLDFNASTSTWVVNTINQVVVSDPAPYTQNNSGSCQSSAA